ncbi:hypothetical protein PENTCL1PPCAC_22422 [Pristionchus entomophagus]|uniref:Uncharacterized protein n=1 Tax=Pristionchus entomophagus TaxID=358040 RepID=A0AAV5U1L3_9BILA|nr:hypothetical protein PENTCL1PPCAC_22422 [Pristionchus entomophagus]
MWSGDGPSRHCGCGEMDCDGEKLWSDFEHCAASVTRVYRECDWRSLQTAAAATTQLYKNGLECHKRGFEKGVQAGRQALAKELYALQGQKMDANVLLGMLAKYVGGADDGRMHRGVRVGGGERDGEGGDGTALHLFQQALNPNPSSSPQRSPELKEFLVHQVARHRKRARSPSSPASLLKRMRRN